MGENMAARSEELLAVERLPNGLTVVGQRMPGVESVAVSFHVRAGSRDEDREIAGVSHFLEHMMFKGTESRSATDISREFEEMGAEFNAFTSHQRTVYYARVLGDRLPDALDVLADMMRPKLNEGEFTTEKGVIIEEIARSEDQPTHELFDHLFETFFSPHPLGNSVLGTVESIRALPVERMREYHTGRYSPNNMVVGVAGNFEWDELLPLVEQKTASWQPREATRREHPFQPSSRAVVEVKPKLQQEHVAVACAAPGEADPDSWAAELLASILGDSSGSRLFWEVAQKGLADSIETAYYGYEGAGMFATYFSASPQHAPEVLRIVRSEMEKLERDGVTEEELGRAKVKAISDTVIGGEASHRRMFEVADLYMSHGRPMSVDEIVAEIEGVTVEAIRALLERYPFSASFTVQAAGPLSEAELIG
jgi:predicted Zn-dependent peptidase